MTQQIVVYIIGVVVFICILYRIYNLIKSTKNGKISCTNCEGCSCRNKPAADYIEK